MSSGDKWSFATDEVFAPLVVLELGAAAAIHQDRDDYPSYGQGTFGFLRRYGETFAGHASSDYFTGAVFPILLHEDPRYFRKEQGGFFRRFGYALSRIPVTRTDRGTNRFNFSEFLGNAAGAALSNTYVPVKDRNAQSAAETFGLFMLSDTLVNVAKEFWPDVRHKLFHGPPPSTPRPPPPQVP